MQRTSKYYNLKWIVQKRDDLHRWWDSMAAFDVEVIAVEYAQMCAKGMAGTDVRYRVIERRGSRDHIVKWEQV